CVEINSSNSTNMYIVMQKSADSGNTWPNSYTVVGHHTDSLDKPWIAADTNSGSPYKNNVYGCWRDDSGSTNIFFKRYVVSGSSTIPYDSDSNEKQLDIGALSGCSIAIGPQGQVYVVYSTDLNSGGGTVYLQRNLHGGDPTMWDTTRYTVGTFNSIPAPYCNYNGGTYECLNGYNGIPFRVNHFPSVAVDSSGSVHVTWMTYTNTNTLTNIMYTNSNSCGTSTGTCTFATPIQVNLDTGARDHWEPAITVSGSGNVIHVTAYDRRDDSQNIFYRPYDYYCSYGPLINCMSQSQWRNIQSSSAGSSNLDQGAYIDDYHGVTTSAARQAYDVWTDSRNLGSNHNYDIYSELTTG
ncbi:MAG: hypothetical protein ACREBJ_00650, partial [Nitrosotalea sp.]